jgi:hypothetical protein
VDVEDNGPRSKKKLNQDSYATKPLDLATPLRMTWLPAKNVV